MFAMEPSIQRENLLHAVTTTASRFVLRDEMHYQAAYTWLVFLSAIDIILTGVVLLGLGGVEANPLAAYIIDQGGFVAASLFKYTLVVIAIILCEIIGRMKAHVGRRLSWVMVTIGIIPVVWTMSLLYWSIAIPVWMAN